MAFEWTDESKKLLMAAAEEDGHITCIRVQFSGGSTIGVHGRKDLVPTGADRRVLAMWIAAVDDLQAAGYIQPTNSQCTLYQVTREGYLALDELKGKADEGA